MTNDHPDDEVPGFVARVLSHGARTAVIDDGGAWSYADLARHSRGIASALLGTRPTLEGARVLLASPSGRGYAAGLLAIWQAGGTAVPLSPHQADAEWDYVADDGEASHAVVAPELGERLQGLASRHGLQVVGTDVAPPVGAGRPGAVSGPAIILYTSGTTSRPKGVVITHANLEFQTRCLCEAWQWRADDRLLNVLPLNHVHGIVNGLLCALRIGACCEMLPRFDPVRVWSRMADRDMSLFMAVPTVYARLMAAWEAAADTTREQWTSGARHLRLMVSGSAALPVSVLEGWRTMTGHTLLERYGMTEIGMALSNPLEGERRAGTVGSPLPGVEVRLLNEQGTTGEAGQPGEIHVRSAGVFREYWRRPEATADAFREGRWFRTGDMAVVEDGYYRILGRLSVDIIKTGGEKVSALEVEEVLRRHPAVSDCAVVGVAHPEWGEQVSAALVLKAGQTVTLENLRAWAARSLSRHRLPRRLVVVPDLPRNALGKVFKPAVRSLFSGDPAD